MFFSNGVIKKLFNNKYVIYINEDNFKNNYLIN